MGVLSKVYYMLNKPEYNKCDNPYCSFRNTLQFEEGRYGCSGPALIDGPSPDARFSGGTTASDDSSSFQYCKGTYLVTKEQASYAFNMLRNDEDRKRVRRDIAAKKAALEARYRAKILAMEVREYAPMKPKDDNTKNGGKFQRLRKENRRLPVVIKTGPPPSAIVTEKSDPTLDNDGDIPYSLSPLATQSSPSQPFLHRRVPSSNASRPTGIIWDDSSLSTDGSHRRQSSQSTRRAQYPPISSNKEQRKSGGTLRAYTNTSVRGPKPWVSSKNGIIITHFGTLLSTAECLRQSSDKENRFPDPKPRQRHG